MISSYRLGDLVLLNLNENEENEILTDYPNSIGSKYILKKIIIQILIIQILIILI